MNLTEEDDRHLPWMGRKLKDPFPVLAPLVLLLPVPGQCDARYPCIICETDCMVLCFSNRSPEWTHLAASPPLCNG